MSPVFTSSIKSSQLTLGDSSEEDSVEEPPQALTPISIVRVMMLVRTLLTMRSSLGQTRFCYMCGGARGLAFTKV